mmetsp:Transcript_29781/g.61503  ORF Transcript_29781/g.61503 Transcript_29781/m.61503 type:complete len:440 (+) Transcript_29781:240-1559(+)
MSGTNTSPVGDDLDDFAGVYEPLSKDGAFVVYRPRAIEDLQEPFQPERTAPREKNTAVPPRVRRCISAVRSRELLKQKALAVTLEPPLVEGKKDDEILQTLRGGGVGAPGVCHLEVDTEAEDSEVSVEPTETGRPCFLERPEECALDGCSHLFVRSKGPLHSADEPPDFLQLPEPIKQRTAGAARVAAAARAWAAATSPPQNGATAALNGTFFGQAAGSERPMVVIAIQDIPPTARGDTDRTAQIMAELRQQGRDASARAAEEARAVEPREAVAGPAILALRRMRNRIAEGLPWASSPRDPSRPRSIMPSFSRRAAPSGVSSNQGATQMGGAASPGGPPAAVSSLERLEVRHPGGFPEPHYSQLVPTAPSAPKPQSNGRGFFRRNWPRMNLMNTLGWGGSSSSSSAQGASSSGEQSRPATANVPRQQDPTPSSGAHGSP